MSCLSTLTIKALKSFVAAKSDVSIPEAFSSSFLMA